MNDMCDTYGIHITHNDSDAIGCALVASQLLSNMKFEDNTHFCTATGASQVLNEILDNIEVEQKKFPGIIIISDLSIDEPTCLRLEDIHEKYGTVLIGVDHHASNNLNEKHKWFQVASSKNMYGDPTLQEMCKPSACLSIFSIILMVHWCEINNAEIGSMMTNKTLSFMKSPKFHIIHNLMLSISRYDTWAWKTFGKDIILGSTEDGIEIRDDIIQILCRFFSPQTLYQKLNSTMNEYNFENDPQNLCLDIHDIYKWLPSYMKIIYGTIKEKESESLKNIISRAKIREIRLMDGSIYKTAMIISTDDFSNAQAEYLYNQSDEIDISCVIYPSTNSISYRTKKPNIDVSALAKQQGGGGHRTAAGVKFNLDEDFLRFLIKYYTQSIPLKDFLEKNK